MPTSQEIDSLKSDIDNITRKIKAVYDLYHRELYQYPINKKFKEGIDEFLKENTDRARKAEKTLVEYYRQEH